MMSAAGDHYHLPDLVRSYRRTTIYIAIATTVVLVLLVWDRFDSPARSACAIAAAFLTGS